MPTSRPRSLAWYLACLTVGFSSAILAALWLLTVDSVFASDNLTIGTSLAVAFMLPIGFAAVWPKRSLAWRLIGGLCGVTGASAGIFVLANIAAMMDAAN